MLHSENLSMARKHQTADVDSLPLSLLPRFASDLFHTHTYLRVWRERRKSGEIPVCNISRPLLSLSLSLSLSRVSFLRDRSIFSFPFPPRTFPPCITMDHTRFSYVNSRTATDDSLKYPKLTHRAPRYSDTVLFIFWCVLAPDFCVEVTHSLVDELRMYETGERIDRVDRGLRVFIEPCVYPLLDRCQIPRTGKNLTRRILF